MIAVLLPMLGAMGGYTWNRTNVFRNEQTLWGDTIEKNPNAWQAHARLGQLFFKRERYAEAEQEFERTVELKPELAEHHNLLGLAECRLGRFEKGIAQYREALRLKEEKPVAADRASIATIRTNLANALGITANNLVDASRTFSFSGRKRCRTKQCAAMMRQSRSTKKRSNWSQSSLQSIAILAFFLPA